MSVTATNAAGATAATTAASARIDPAPTVNTAAPAISGTARDGQTLTVDNGTWTGTPRSPTPTSGAAATPPARTAPTSRARRARRTRSAAADVGATIRAVVTATNAAGATAATAPQSATVAPAAPVNTAAPALAGTERDGETLTVDRGRWTGTPTIAYAYQWRRCDTSGANCADIAGATQAAYTLTAADAGTHRPRRRHRDERGRPTSASTPASATVKAAPPANATVPLVSGTLRDGETLTATRGTWTGTDPISFAYRWQRCDGDAANCDDIGGATGTTYALTAADVGHRIRFAATATNTAGSATAGADPTDRVVAAPPANRTPPAVDGTARDGSTLTVTSDGQWDGTPAIAFAYAWLRCDENGGGARDPRRRCSARCRSSGRSSTSSSGRRSTWRTSASASSRSGRWRSGSAVTTRTARCAAPTVEPEFLVCPVCTTKLKQACVTCKHPLEPLWQVCPYCETPIVRRSPVFEETMALPRRRGVASLAAAAARTDRLGRATSESLTGDQ